MLVERSALNRFHTPVFCQSRNRLQQVEPEPYPNLVKRSRQRIPVSSTNRIPFRAARFATGNRQPAWILLAPWFWRRQQWLDQCPQFVINDRRGHPWFQLFRRPRLTACRKG
ncbi:hypothetical protein X961_5617 [Burkholderia pseudomallei MSHR5613]|nr:hypothetical protein X961_5617 [Burkholderia pseudomallei MSHR5613]